MGPRAVIPDSFLLFISFFFIVFCSGIARLIDTQDGQTQWSPLTEIMKGE